MRIVGVLVAALALGVLATPGAASGQPKADAARVGFLTGPAGLLFVDAFRQGLRDLGWSEGRVVVEYRVGEGDRLPQRSYWPGRTSSSSERRAATQGTARQAREAPRAAFASGT